MDAESILKIADILVPAAAGLVGVLVGGLIASHGQKEERRHAWIRRQLLDFYSPMLGLRARILAKSETRVKIGEAMGAAWRQLESGLDPEQSQKLEKERAPDFQKIIQENNRALVEEILPLYRKMVDHFSANMGLAEPETRAYFGALVEFIDLWDRWLAKTIPAEVLGELGHSEQPLHAFYADLAQNLNRLAKELRK